MTEKETMIKDCPRQRSILLSNGNWGKCKDEGSMEYLGYYRRSPSYARTDYSTAKRHHWRCPSCNIVALTKETRK